MDAADQVGAVCEVAIVGLGPVGATLAALLGERGVDVIVIDPAAEPLPYPRAIAADDEMLRTMLRVPGLSEPQRLFGGEPRCEVRDSRGALLTTVTFGETALGLPGCPSITSPRWKGSCAPRWIGCPAFPNGSGRP